MSQFLLSCTSVILLNGHNLHQVDLLLLLFNTISYDLHLIVNVCYLVVSPNNQNEQ